MAQIEITQHETDAGIARILHGTLASALSGHTDPIAISIPGGSTPFPILQHLTQSDLEWDRIRVWPGDDRRVPEDHAASNTGKIRQLLEPLGAHVIALEEGLVPPRFAMVWLGMGADGHIASLFPNTDPRADDPLVIRCLTPDPLPPEAPFDRITLTMPALTNSAQMMFVIRGDDKREVFEDAMAGKHDLPIARLLAAFNGTVRCFL